MSCYYPRLALRLYVDKEHKAHIKFFPKARPYFINDLRKRFGDDLLLLPCGKCLGCKFDKAKDWATRCVCEMQYHKEACFLTLTYNNENYPGKLVKSHLIDFIKALRNRGVKCRYVGCGELGKQFLRAHYHLILFGYRPDDLELHSRSDNGDLLYTSKYLEKLWAKGFVMVGDVSYQSAGYVARYTTKKVADDDSFLVCSNRPGIGYQYYEDHKQDILSSGFVYGDFGDSYKAPVPRYFEKYLRKEFPDQYDALIIERMQKVLFLQDNDLINHKFTNPEELKIYNADILDRKLKRFERS